MVGRTRIVERLKKYWADLRADPRKLKIVIILLILIVVPIVSSAWLYINNVPTANKLCTVCHNMEPFYEAIDQSGHRELNCHKCHPLTLEALIKGSIAQILENPSPLDIKEKSSPDINMYEECIQCHLPEKLEEKHIHVIHLGMIELTGSCDTCHDPHSPSDLSQACLKCHEESNMINIHAAFHEDAIFKVESGETEICGQCHSSAATWLIPLSPSCTQGGVEGKGCFECHTSSLNPPDITGRECTECHR